MLGSLQAGRRSIVEDRTAEQERRSGIIWSIAGLTLLALMVGAWWLVEETNEQGEHDAELLPLFALVPLGVGAYHLIRSRARDT
jgi:hypothetical protein